MSNAFAHLLRRPVTDWLLLLEAALSLASARTRLFFCTFAQIAPTLGTPQAETLRIGSPAADLGKRIGWAVEAISRHSPLPLVCLPQAMAAQRMLARRGLPSTLYLGVQFRRTEPQPLAAHAWLRLGDRLLTGRPARPQFATVASFAWVRPPPANAIKWLRRGAALAALLSLASLSLMPTPPLRMLSWTQFPPRLQPVVQWLGVNDFAANVLGVGTTNLLIQILAFGRHRGPWWLRLRLLGTMLLGVVGLECAQLFMPSRSFDLLDMVAGLVGLLLTSWPWIRFRSR